MLSNQVRRNLAAIVAGMAIVWAFGASQASAQPRGKWQPLQVIEAGTRVSVVTTREIDERDPSGRVFAGVVDRDVLDSRGRLAIPRGANVELVVRRGGNRELYLDLESIGVNGQWYGVDATKREIEGETHVDSSIGANRETAEHVGGGALIGSIIGAIVGGGKGAAVGAAAGAGVGAATQIQVHGEFVRVPPESLVTFRLESPLRLGGGHHHNDDRR